VVFDFEVLIELGVDVVDLFSVHHASAGGALLDLGKRVHDGVSELVLLDDARHEPLSVETEKVEPVVTLIDSDEVNAR